MCLKLHALLIASRDSQLVRKTFRAVSALSAALDSIA